MSSPSTVTRQTPKIITETFLSARFSMALLVLPFVRLLTAFTFLSILIPSVVSYTTMIKARMADKTMLDPNLDREENLQLLGRLTLLVAFVIGGMVNLSNVTYGINIVMKKPAWSDIADDYLDRYLVTSYISFGVLALQAAFFEDLTSLAPLATATGFGIFVDFLAFIFFSKALGASYKAGLIVSAMERLRQNHDCMEDAWDLQSQNEEYNDYMNL